MSKWFVMLNGQGRWVAPMTQGDTENVALYDSEDEADTAAQENPLGAACGYEVYEWNYMQ
jgi:hypothetical protein